MADRSIIEYSRKHEGYRCGYCGQKNSNYSNGMWADTLTCMDYQNLIDRGWRRCGKYCYKPDMKKMCCPSYTIRCASMNFRPSKSQKKVMKKMTKYLTQTGSSKEVEPRGKNNVGEEEKATEAGHGVGGDTMTAREHPEFAHEKCFKKVKLNDTVHDLNVVCDGGDVCHKNSNAAEGRTAGVESPRTSGKLQQPDSLKISCKQKREKHIPAKGSGPDPKKPPCKKAKKMRQERREKKLLQQGSKREVAEAIEQNQKGPVIKSLEEFLIDRIPGQTPVHSLEIKLVRSDKLAESTESFKETHSLYQKYQMAIHKHSPSECDELQFMRFLVDSPLIYERGPDTPTEGFGSFHQQYYIDGKLIAVGVLDILPKCVSSEYFYYDPEYSFLSLGTYSALRELHFTRELHRNCSTLLHYYMGFYNHSYPKMKYKGQYEGSELLCPETYRWVSINTCRPKLDVSSYSRLHDSEGNEEDVSGNGASKDVSVLFNRQAMPYQDYQRLTGADDEEEVREYAELVGKSVASQMLLFRGPVPQKSD